MTLDVTTPTTTAHTFAGRGFYTVFLFSVFFFCSLVYHISCPSELCKLVGWFFLSLERLVVSIKLLWDCICYSTIMHWLVVSWLEAYVLGFIFVCLSPVFFFLCYIFRLVLVAFPLLLCLNGYVFCWLHIFLFLGCSLLPGSQIMLLKQNVMCCCLQISFIY